MHPRTIGPQFVRVLSVYAAAVMLVTTAGAESKKRNVYAVASPLTDEGLALDRLVVELGFDEAAYRRIKRHARAVITGFRAAPEVWLNLALEQFSVTTPQTRFVRDGDIRIDGPDVVLLRGSIIGEPDTHVFLGISPNGSNGYIQRGEQMYLVSTYAPDSERPWETVTYAFLREDMPPSDAEPWTCLTDTLGPLPGYVNGGGGIGDGNLCVEAVVAIETDYQYFQIYGNEAAANAYIVQIVGATSDVYERDTGIQLEIGFSRVWTAPNDPWTNSNSQNFFEFTDYWNQNMTHVERTSVHMLSGKNGGGVAYYPGMCVSGFDYALSHVNGSFPEPLRSNNAGNWDMHVVPHEWGHIYGTLHTHDGYVPPIDTCASDCGDGRPRQGTIMSYCHLCNGGERNIVLEFHGRVSAEIIRHSSSTGCLTESIACAFTLRGDLNCDGVINALDIEPFLLGLFDRAEYDRRWPACDAEVLGDTNADGHFDSSDIESFLGLLFA